MHKKLMLSLVVFATGSVMFAGEGPKKDTCVIRLINNEQDVWSCHRMKKFVYRDGDKLVLGGIYIGGNGLEVPRGATVAEARRIEQNIQRYPHSILMTWGEFAAQRPVIAQALMKAPDAVSYTGTLDPIHDTTSVRVCWGSENLLTQYLQQGSVTKEKFFVDHKHFHVLDSTSGKLRKRAYAEETHAYFPNFTNQPLASVPLFIEKDAWEMFKEKVKAIATSSHKNGLDRLNQLCDDAQHNYNMYQERRKKMITDVRALSHAENVRSEALIEQIANKRLGRKFIDDEEAASSKLLRLKQLKREYTQIISKNYQECLESLESIGIEIEVEHA